MKVTCSTVIILLYGVITLAKHFPEVRAPETSGYVIKGFTVC